MWPVRFNFEKTSWHRGNASFLVIHKGEYCGIFRHSLNF